MNDIEFKAFVIKETKRIFDKLLQQIVVDPNYTRVDYAEWLYMLFDLERDIDE